MPPPVVLPFPIPDSILLLLHLHLLQCTLPEAQDPNLFNPNSYGIGERIKNMERIVYFLMSVIENDKIKAILPMYPTKQPSEVIAFRNAVIKYLETIRANALKAKSKSMISKSSAASASAKKPAPLKGAAPSSRTASVASTRSASTALSSRQPSSRSPSVQSKPRAVSHTVSSQPIKSVDTKKPGTSSSSIVDECPGWWWKDVLIRKSLFEECTGQKFERVLLALSIHALFSYQMTVASTSQTDEKSAYLEILGKYNQAPNLELFDSLKEQPDEYRSLVQRMKALQIRLAKERESVTQQRRNIQSLKATLSASKLDGREDSIQSLEESYQAYLTRLEPKSGLGDAERNGPPNSLRWIFSMAGVNIQDRSSPGESEKTGESKEKRDRKSTRMTVLPAPPLPTVAAHHPNHKELLRRLEEDVTNLKSVDDLDSEDVESDRIDSKQDGGVYAALVEEETNLTNLLGRFHEEMEALDELLEKELIRKQEEVDRAYNQARQDEETEMWNLSTVVHEFKLDFEMPSVPAPLPPFLQAKPEQRDHAIIAKEIHEAIQAPDTPSVSSEEEGEDFLDEGDVPVEEVESSALGESDEEEADRTVLHAERPRSVSPQKSRIPSWKTPKKDVETPRAVPTSTRSFRFGGTEDDTIVLSTPLASPSRHKRSSPNRSQRTPKPTVHRQKSPLHRERGSPSRIMATPSLFITPTKARGMEDIKDILPPFQSPWRSVNRSQAYWDMTPRKSGRVSIGKPRTSGVGTGKRPRLSKGRVGSSSSFVRTPLKSGKRLSNIIPPVSYAPLAFGQATPRVSLDNVYEEVVEDLVRSASMKTPPHSSPSRRLLDSKNNIQRSSPFKNLLQSGRGPKAPESPEIQPAIDEEPNENDLFGGNEWEDVLEEAKYTSIFPDHTSTVRRQSAAKRFGERMSLGATGRRKSSRQSGNLLAVAEDEYMDGPSFTLRDILLKVGQDGMLGANGTFNMDLIHETEIEGGDDSILGGL